MKNNKMQDERIILARRKIQSDAYQFLVYILIISILVQQFFLNAPFSQFAVEFFCLIGCGLYMIIRHLTAGIDIWNSKLQNHKNLFISVVISGIVSVVLFAFFSGEDNLINLILFFVCFTVANFFMYTFMRLINNKKQKDIDDKLNDDEMSIK